MKSRNQFLLNLFLILGIVAAVNLVGTFLYKRLDLTEDQRFTLTDPSIKILEELDQTIYVKVLLDGKLPVEFQRLQSAVIEQLEQYKKLSGGLVQYEIANPNVGTVEQKNKAREELAKQRVLPINLRVVDTDAQSEQLVYPYVIFRRGVSSYPVNILESESVAVSPEMQLNNSIGLLEYKYSNAINKLMQEKKKNIAFLAGHGELEKPQTIDLENDLRKYYNTGRLYLDSTYKVDERIDLLIVPRPRETFSEQHKFMIDQYLMKGGKILWLIDRLNVSMDSLRLNKRYVPYEYNLNLDDFFFKHGVRINSDLVQDLESTRIPLTINQGSGAPRYELYKWPYSILAVPKPGHPITNNLDRVNLDFPSTIDTLKTKFDIQKTVVLTSSDYSRFQLTPVQLELNSVRVPLVPEKFNKPKLPVGVLLEGEFVSLYENRVTEELLSGLEELNETFHKKSPPTKMMVISDGNIIYNMPKSAKGDYWPAGYNIFERRKFANIDFILNSIEYLIGEGAILQSRTKEVKLRLLNTVKATEEKTKWQLINVGLPLLALALFGLLFNYIRRRKFTQH